VPTPHIGSHTSCLGYRDAFVLADDIVAQQPARRLRKAQVLAVTPLVEEAAKREARDAAIAADIPVLAECQLIATRTDTTGYESQ
jgi:hypothetical protein